MVLVINFLKFCHFKGLFEILVVEPVFFQILPHESE